MTEKEISKTYDTACALLIKKQVKQAFDELQKMADSLKSWQLSEETNRLQETYRMMLQYAVSGISDPEQRKIYLSLVAGCFRLAENLRKNLMQVYSANYVYSQKRYFERIYLHLPQNLMSELELAYANAGLSDLLEESLNATGKRKEYAQQHEALSLQLFRQFWFANHCSNEEIQLFKDLMESDLIAVEDKCLALSGLTLSLLRSFDEQRLLLLVEQCTHTDEAVSQRALAGLLPVLAKYNSQLPFFPAMRNRLVMLFDNEEVSKSVKHIILQYIRTNETEHLTQKMNNEILPEMLKIAPKIKQKIEEKAAKATDGEIYSIEAIMGGEDPDEKNPEWEEVLEETGIVEKLQEMSELQMEGSDVYMSTFSRLKNYSFFQEAGNWFRPFNTRYSEIFELFQGNENPFVEAMTAQSFMCNSDRYSFCLHLLEMPEMQRKMMSQAFAAEAEQMNEIGKEERILAKSKSAEMISNAYIQDLYRFFNLFPHRTDFVSPFAWSLSLHNTWFFSLIDHEEADLRQIAEFYFAKNLFPQALEMFERLTENSVDLCQKKGYCQQQAGDYEKALQHYLQAEIIAPNSKWTIRKIAYCYRMMEDYENALTFYQRAAEFLPENISLQIQIGNCYRNLKKYDDALACYFKVDYLTEDNLKMWRAIAWTSFLSGKNEQAIKFYKKAIELKPEWTDYLNAAHVTWTLGDEKQAITLYKQALDVNKKNIETFARAFNADTDLLVQKGIDSEHIAIVLDFLRYYSEN